jgi:hypothetical protein
MPGWGSSGGGYASPAQRGFRAPSQIDIPPDMRADYYDLHQNTPNSVYYGNNPNPIYTVPNNAIGGPINQGWNFVNEIMGNNKARDPQTGVRRSGGGAPRD